MLGKEKDKMNQRAKEEGNIGESKRKRITTRQHEDVRGENKKESSSNPSLKNYKKGAKITERTNEERNKEGRQKRNEEWNQRRNVDAEEEDVPREVGESTEREGQSIRDC